MPKPLISVQEVHHAVHGGHDPQVRCPSFGPEAVRSGQAPNGSEGLAAARDGWAFGEPGRWFTILASKAGLARSPRRPGSGPAGAGELRLRR